jgi:hypothetical protein
MNDIITEWLSCGGGGGLRKAQVFLWNCFVILSRQSVRNRFHSWSWALLEKLPIVQLLKNFPAFYGIRRFIVVYTRALHWFRPGPRLFEHFRNKLIFYDEELLAPRPTPKLEDHPLSALRDCLFNIFAATLHTWRASPPSATWGRAMPWWQGTHLTWKGQIHSSVYLNC